MKRVKSLLLGSAAGVVALTGTQAADLPVKAKPVRYVKICSLYGAGFFYIPGTDTCLKIGGYVRAEYNFNAGGSFTPVTNGVNAVYNRTSALETLRGRIKVSVDVRSETEYGTLRAYGTLVTTFTTPATAAPTSAGADRAFIQFAGFTLGQANSFFDYFNWTSYSNQTNFISTDTGGAAGSGWLLAAYTAQLGNGFSATISVEDPHLTTILDTANAGTLTAIGGLTSSYAGFNGFPDIVANLRVDQSWGSAQIMGAIHDVRASYYTGVAGTNVPPVNNVGTVQGNGYPGDEVGWAAGAGIFLNLPMLAPGDNIAAQFTYAQGATAYIVNRSFGIFKGSVAGVGWSTDAVFNSGVPGSGSAALSGLELTEAWNVMGGFQHVWNPQWKTSLYGGYARVDYTGAATAWLNGVTGFSGSPDFAFWQVGSRTVWTPVLNLDLSVDVMYNKIETAYAGNTFVTAVASKPAAGNQFGDQDVWAFILRAQRNFWP